MARYQGKEPRFTMQLTQRQIALVEHGEELAEALRRMLAEFAGYRNDDSEEITKAVQTMMRRAALTLAKLDSPIKRTTRG